MIGAAGGGLLGAVGGALHDDRAHFYGGQAENVLRQLPYAKVKRTQYLEALLDRIHADEAKELWKYVPGVVAASGVAGGGAGGLMRLRQPKAPEAEKTASLRDALEAHIDLVEAVVV
jgi:hypothetical protein